MALFAPLPAQESFYPAKPSALACAPVSPPAPTGDATQDKHAAQMARETLDAEFRASRLQRLCQSLSSLENCPDPNYVNTMQGGAMQKSWRRKVAEWLLEFVDEFGLPNDIGKFRPLVICPSPFVPVPCARGESAFSLPFGGLFFSFFFLFFFNENCSESPRQRSLPLVPPSLADPPPLPPVTTLPSFFICINGSHHCCALAGPSQLLLSSPRKLRLVQRSLKMSTSLYTKVPTPFELEDSFFH